MRAQIFVKCRDCGYAARPGECPQAESIYHDLICPECGSFDLDTSELRKRTPGYEFGDNNTYRFRKVKSRPRKAS